VKILFQRPASAERRGIESRRRYAAILAAAMRKVAANPDGPTTRSRAELAPGLRSFHVQHAHVYDPNARVRRPVHILYYRVIASDLIEIIRVLHERMDPIRHLHEFSGD
jgi:toxin ParE1/3/4